MAFWVKMFEEGLVHAVTDHRDRLVLDTGSLDIAARRVGSDPDCELRRPRILTDSLGLTARSCFKVY